MRKSIPAGLVAAAVLCGQSSRDVSRETARPSPEWVRNGVFYEINTRTFSREGTFKGITAQLDRLQQLGVNILWLMPVQPTGEEKKKGTLGSLYSIRDYYSIKPEYGTAGDLKHLVHEAHARGLKVILDMVPNHTAWDNPLVKQHPEFYLKDAAGKVRSPIPEWDDVAGLDYKNSAVREYMTGVFEHWLRDFDLDGFRVDVAGISIPTDYWESMRPRLEAIKSDIVMLAEWHSPDLLLKAYDCDYAWPFHAAINGVFRDGKPAGTIREEWEQQHSQYPRGALEMRFVDNHDEKRSITRFGDRGSLAAAALVFTSDGVPAIYNGVEVGDTVESNGAALFEPQKVLWQSAAIRPEFPQFYRAIIELRRKHPALTQGETVWLRNSEPDGVITYLRRARNEEFLVVINSTNRPVMTTVEVESTGAWHEVTPGASPSWRIALPAVSLEGFGFRIFRR